MPLLLAMSSTVAVFTILWVYLGLSFLSLPVWVGFLGWAVFYAAGGKMDGLRKGLPAILSGVFWGWLTATIWTQFTDKSPLALALILAVVAFTFVYTSQFDLVAFVPGVLVGAASFFGVILSGGNLIQVVVCLVGGLLIGYVQQLSALALAKEEKKEENKQQTG